MEISDELLVQKVLDGDKSSFGILVDRYKRSVFLQSIRTTRDFHEAEDITQDVFLKSYLNLQKLREPAKFGSWLRGITQNLCLKWIHKKQMLSDLEIPLDNLQTEVLNQWLKEQDNSESWEFGMDVANKLSDEQKSLLRFFYIDNYSCREIAQRMEASEVAIRQRLSRTRQQLKTELLEGEKNMNRMIAISAIYALLLGGTLSVSGGTWRDDFEDGDLEGWEVVNADEFKKLNPAWFPEGLGVFLEEKAWSVENGICVGNNMQGSDSIVTGDTSWTDYSVQANIKILEAAPVVQHGASIILRGSDDGRYYAACIVPLLKPRIVLCAHPDMGFPWIDVPVPVKLNTWYKLNIVVKSTNFKVYLDDNLIASFDDGAITSGRVGLSVSKVQAHFDDVIITGEEILDGGSGYVIESKSKLATTWGNMKQAR